MDSNGFAARLNPRVIVSLASTPAEKEMALAGVHSEGIRIMSARAEFLVLRMDAVPIGPARRIKQAMLDLGGEAAIDESAWSGTVTDTPVIIMGTRRQVKDLLKVLGGDESSSPVADMIATTLDYYHRKSFALTLPAGPMTLPQNEPVIMGILNVTPDSFSDGGKYLDVKAAVAKGLQMAAEGAGIIDIGGESTRPGSGPVSADDEAARIIPVIDALSKEAPCPISVDTSKAGVAQKALDAGAWMINDVTALADPAMREVAARAGCPVVLMHMKGTPLTMQKSPFYRDLVGEITAYLRAAIDRAVAAGINREQIIIDPGIGFGKTVGHNLEILRRLKEFSSLGRPILLGPSRKSFIGATLTVPPGERVFGTAAAVALAVAGGARILRVHDVAGMRQVALMAAAAVTDSPGEVG